MPSSSLFLLALLTAFSAAAAQPSAKAKNIAQFLQSSIEFARTSLSRPNASNQLDGCLGPALLRPHGLFDIPQRLGVADFAVNQVFMDSVSNFTPKVLATSRAPHVSSLQLSFGEMAGGGELTIDPSSSKRFLFTAQPFRVVIEMELLLSETSISIANSSIEALDVEGSIFFLNNNSLSDYHHKLEDFMVMDALNQCLAKLTDVLEEALLKQLKLVTRSSIENGSALPRSPRTPRAVQVQFLTHKVNQLVAKLKKKMLRNAKRMRLPDFNTHFNKKLFVTISGGFDLFRGKVVDISDLKQHGDIVIEVQKYTFIDIPLELRNLAVYYYSRLYVTNVTVRPHFTVTTDRVRFHLQTRTRDGMEVRKVQVTALGRIDVEVEGLYSLNWLSSVVATYVANSFKELLIPHMEDVLLRTATSLRLEMWE